MKVPRSVKSELPHRNKNAFFSGSNGVEQSKAFFPVSVQQQISPTQQLIQLKPAYLVWHRFMGRSVEVNPEMRNRLQNVEADLQTQYDTLPAATRPATLANYAGFQSIRGWRSGSSTSRHASGSAVDVNYTNQPYIATRSQVGTTTVFGGEEGGATAATRALRQPAVEVYDRATEFMNLIPLAGGATPSADVNQRRPGESTADVYRRFRSTSDALAGYLSLAFHTNYDAVLRPPVANIEAATEAQILAAIPVTERKDETTGIADITAFMSDPAWQSSHSGFPQTARDTYFRILRDYEHVRIPMERGNPSTSPDNTRNPALGFLHMPEHFVVSMVDVGHLRWGAADLGENESGDVHHFDIRNHGGFTPDGTP